jgi:PleD family two-component response regulator
MEFITIGTESKAKGRLTRSFVAVNGDQQQEELLDALLADEHDYGVVFVESIARSYSRIKQVVPDVVIVYCAMDDFAACQLLSMLKLDAELSRIRVVTCANAPSNGESPDFFSEMVEPEPVITQPVQMN